METKIIKFYATDGLVLNGYINKGNSNSKKVLIQIHGMTSNCFKNRDEVISKKINEINIDTICFNTRGSEIVKYIQYKNGDKKLGGMAFEDVEESYFDIAGAMKYAIKLGYTDIYLQGHSLGATKIVYAHQKMRESNDELLKYIKGIILLSLVDIPGICKEYSKIEFLEYAEEKETKGDVMELMPIESFLHPVSVKTFLRYVKYNKNIDFAPYDLEDNEFEILNQIEVPLFMRWGNIKELIKRNAQNQVEFMKKKIKNNKKDIEYIDGADHSYHGKEEFLAEQIKIFLENIK